CCHGPSPPITRTSRYPPAYCDGWWRWEVGDSTHMLYETVSFRGGSVLRYETVSYSGERRPVVDVTSKLDPEREQAILRATLDLLAETGYECLRLDAVAAKAKASKATLYRH